MNNEADFANLIMDRIEKEKIKIRSKSLVLAVNCLKAGLFITSLGTNALFVSFIFYWLQSSPSLGFINLGRLGVLAFLQSLPYWWILTSLAVFVISGIVLKQYDLAYKKPYKLLLVLIFVFTGFFGGLINTVGANKAIVEKIKRRQNRKQTYLSPIWDSEVGVKEKNGVYGEVVEVKPGALQLCIEEETVEVIFSKAVKASEKQEIKKSDWVMAVGTAKNGNFEAISVKKMPEKQTNAEPAPEQNEAPTNETPRVEKENDQNSPAEKAPLQHQEERPLK